MAIIPPYDPNERPDRHPLDPTGRQAPDPDMKFVSGETAEDERMSVADHMAVMAGIGCAITLRFALLGVVVAIVIGLVYLSMHA